MLLKKGCQKKIQSVEEILELSLLDMPELVIEGILKRLPAAALCLMACTCRELRRRCSCDHLWETLLHDKWDTVLGPDAYTAWQHSLALSQGTANKTSSRSRAWFWPFSCFWYLSCCQNQIDKEPNGGTSRDSVMIFYTALENGNFWFPAQVFNREHGHVGFLLSCYDAEVRYNRTTNSFCARYPPHGARNAVVEEGVSRERVRVAPVNFSAHNVYRMDDFDELFPGDQVEVQWKRNSEFPYGWWYGMIGHVDSCNRENPQCLCHLEDVVWLEFKQYAHGSRWRRAAIKRKRLNEEGNEAEGFYGGIRKLYTKEEIYKWMQLWPKEYLE